MDLAQERKPCAISPEFREYAELTKEALAVLRVVQHRQRQADVLSVPAQQQVIAAVLLPLVKGVHMTAVFVIQEMVPLFAVRVGEHIPFEIGPELRPEECDFLFGNGFPDGDFVFHFFSSKHQLEG